MLEKLEKFYENECREKFEDAKREILGKIVHIMNKHKDKYSLQYNNSVHTGEYYKFSTRVKTKESVSEKLIRSSKLLSLKKKYTSLEDIEQSSEELFEYFKKWDDVIGIKIIGDLGVDRENIFKLLIDKISDFETVGIVFENINKQPVSMKNGLKIYKIKARYNQYLFELQIKSQLESAWGEMEHQIFYKDYDFTPVKNPTQSIMNRVGELLNQIDELLYSIRNVKKEYKLEEEFSSFASNLYRVYSDHIKNFLDIDYEINISVLSNFLFNVYSVLTNKYDSISLDNIPEPMISDDFKGFEINNEHSLLANFSRVKELNFELQVLEFILLNWLHFVDKYSGNKESYIESLEYYFLDIYKSYICEKYNVEDNGWFSNILKSILSKVLNKDAFLGSKEFEYITNYFKMIIDLSGDLLEENGDLTEDMFKQLTLIYGLYVFDGQLDTAVIHETNKVFNDDMSLIVSLYENMKNNIDDINSKLYSEYQPFIDAHKEIMSILEEKMEV